MKYLTKESEVNALRSYLCEHSVTELSKDLDVCYITAKRIADSYGDCNVRAAEAKRKLQEILLPYFPKEAEEFDESGCSQIDSTPAIRRAVLTELITEQLEYLDNNQLKEELAHLIRINGVGA